MAICAVAMVAVGAFFLVYLRGAFFAHPVRAARKMRAALGQGERPVRTLILALSGTLGVGNLSGVAVGVAVGGVGSVLWMAIAGIVACVLKYAEGIVAVSGEDSGGMMTVIGRSWRYGRALSCGYAAVCLGVAFVMGAALQSRAIGEVAQASVGISPLTATVLTALALLVAVGSSHRGVDRVTAVCLPFAMLCYTVMGTVYLFVRRDALPEALSSIVRGAMQADGVLGGILGALTSQAMRQGFAGSLLSNEAGAGTSTLAHAENAGATPVGEGLLGVLEIVFDTALCLLTGLVLACDGTPITAGGVGHLTRVLSGTLGDWCAWVMLPTVIAFAFSTVVCWLHYGQRCARFLLGKRAVYACTAVYVLFVVLGGIVPTVPLVALADTGLCILVLVTLPTLLRQRRAIRAQHKAAFSALHTSPAAPDRRA